MSQSRLIPLISIVIPAYNRPQWLKRALESIILTKPSLSSEIEIVVSDDSDDSSCQIITQETLANWGGKTVYCHNGPALGMAPNWNQGIKLASGKYILVLHDDDYLLPRGLEKIIDNIKKISEYAVFLFGVQVVNEQEKILKQQTFPQQQYLSPKIALTRLLSNSSFVRFPAIVVKRDIFLDIGYFNPQWGEPTDIDMWIRLFSRYGVCCIPATTCAYTVHNQALTMGVFKEKTIQTLLDLFTQVESLYLFEESELKNYQSQFLHQFILAGAFRMLRRGRWGEFHQIMELFNLPILKDLPYSRKWGILRMIFQGL